jgi:hypothetical protein
MLPCNCVVKMGNHDAFAAGPMNQHGCPRVQVWSWCSTRPPLASPAPYFLKAILEPERTYFNTSLNEWRREQDAARNQKRKL